MASTDWEEVRKYVEPVVSEINQPGAELVRIEVVLLGDGQESVSAEFSYTNPSPERNAALVRHAADLLRGHADSIERRRTPYLPICTRGRNDSRQAVHVNSEEGRSLTARRSARRYFAIQLLGLCLALALGITFGLLVGQFN